MPKVIITDGLLSYHFVAEGAKQLCCLFHHQQEITRWLSQHFSDKETIQKLKSRMKRVFQTQDKRTVKRRFAKLSENADRLGIREWVDKIQHHLEHL